MVRAVCPGLPAAGWLSLHSHLVKSHMSSMMLNGTPLPSHRPNCWRRWTKSLASALWWRRSLGRGDR